MRRLSLAFCAAMIASPATSHPHIFVDTGVEVFFDEQGRLTSLRLSWTYDELFSLIILEDRGLDNDYDGVLTEEEQAALTGFDMIDWPEWYDGDLYVLAGGRKLQMGDPREYDLVLEDGKLVTTHYRDLPEPLTLGASPVIVQIYDEGYYTAYEIIGHPQMVNAPQDCQAVTYAADLSAAQQEVKAALAEISADINLEEVGFPKIGAAFSDEVRISC